MYIKVRSDLVFTYKLFFLIIICLQFFSFEIQIFIMNWQVLLIIRENASFNFNLNNVFWWHFLLFTLSYNL